VNVLVTGGTGTLGRHVVTLLRQSGHRARIFTRRPRGHVDAIEGDLKTGAGFDKALAGMEVIVHAASATTRPLRGRSTDVDGTRRLLEKASAAGIAHIVFVSIVGIDRVDYPYYKTKLATEHIVRESAVPWSILRATQFHQFVDFLLQRFSRVPRLTAVPFAWRLQPVEVTEVARRLVEIALHTPTNTTEDFGGPEVRDLKSLTEAWLAAREEKRRLVNLNIPLAFSAQIAGGGLLCPDHTEGKITFDDYLAERYPS
jgi:uncharacterized protein YbjT (DUF2867 family)